MSSAYASTHSSLGLSAPDGASGITEVHNDGDHERPHVKSCIRFLMTVSTVFKVHEQANFFRIKFNSDKKLRVKEERRRTSYACIPDTHTKIKCMDFDIRLNSSM